MCGDTIIIWNVKSVIDNSKPVILMRSVALMSAGKSRVQSLLENTKIRTKERSLEVDGTPVPQGWRVKRGIRANLSQGRFPL